MSALLKSSAWRGLYSLLLLARSVPSLAKVGEEPLCLGSAQALVQPEIQVLMPQRISLREEALCSRHVLVNAAAHLLVLVLGEMRHFPSRIHGTMHFNRVRQHLAGFAFCPGLPFPWPCPQWSTLVIKHYQSTIALLTYYCNTSLECWSAVIYHGAISENWQVTGTPDPETDHFYKLYGLFFFSKTASKGKESSVGMLPRSFQRL